MKTIVVGDIHGCYNELRELVVALVQSGKYNKNEDKIVFLGDYIDRGENSRKVIELIRNLQKANCNVIALKGNHEEMFLEYQDGLDDNWLWNGYKETLMSYRGFEAQIKNDMEWMESLPIYHEDDNFIFVHAGIDVNKAMEDQEAYTMLWVRNEFIYSNTPYHKRVIFGHTPTFNLNQTSKPVYTYAGNVAIDTGCVFGGALTALILEDGEVKEFFQTNNNEEDEEDYEGEFYYDEYEYEYN